MRPGGWCGETPGWWASGSCLVGKAVGPAPSWALGPPPAWVHVLPAPVGVGERQAQA